MTGRTLYHCLYREPQGDALLPRSLREENGREDCFLYATPDLVKSLAFAFSYHDFEICCNGGIEGSDNEFAVITGGPENLYAPRHIRVYTFPDTGFEQTHDERQFVSRHPVPFSETKLAFESVDVRDLMREGLQIFMLDIPKNEDSVKKLISSIEDIYGNKMLFTLLQDDRARWMNRELDINPDARLQQDFSRLSQVGLPSAKPFSSPTLG